MRFYIKALIYMLFFAIGVSIGYNLYLICM